MTKHLLITQKELDALMDCAASCESMGEGVTEEGKRGMKAYKAVMRRNDRTIESYKPKEYILISPFGDL